MRQTLRRELHDGEGNAVQPARACRDRCERACGSTTRFWCTERGICERSRRPRRCNRRGEARYSAGSAKARRGAWSSCWLWTFVFLWAVADVGFRRCLPRCRAFPGCTRRCAPSPEEHDLRLAPGKAGRCWQPSRTSARKAASPSLFALVCSACAAEFQQRRAAARSVQVRARSRRPGAGALVAPSRCFRLRGRGEAPSPADPALQAWPHAVAQFQRHGFHQRTRCDDGLDLARAAGSAYATTIISNLMTWRLFARREADAPSSPHDGKQQTRQPASANIPRPRPERRWATSGSALRQLTEEYPTSAPRSTGSPSSCQEHGLANVLSLISESSGKNSVTAMEGDEAGGESTGSICRRRQRTTMVTGMTTEANPVASGARSGRLRSRRARCTGWTFAAACPAPRRTHEHRNAEAQEELGMVHRKRFEDGNLVALGMRSPAFCSRRMASSSSGMIPAEMPAMGNGP